jgi:hypothetical protein
LNRLARFPSALRSATSATLRRCGLLGALGALALGSCDAIVGAGNRELNDTIVCNDQGCTCAEHQGDCDGDPDNGCELLLDTPDNCGACGVVCQNGGCEDFTCACSAGRAECDGDPETQCETELATDSKHCGLCGRDCVGATCVEGLCEPEPVTNGPIFSFTVAGDTLYYATYADMGMFRVPLTGGATPEPFADPMTFVNLVQYHGDAVYWTSEMGVHATNILTGETVQLASDQSPGGRLAVGGDKVYWGNLDVMTNIASLHRAPTTPGGTVDVVTELGNVDFVFDFAVSEEHVYWNDIDLVMRSPHDMLAAELWKTVGVPATYLEPLTDGLLYAGNPGGTFFVPYAVGKEKQLAEVDGYGVLAGDAEYVYWVNFVFGASDPPALWRAPRSGEGPTLKLWEDPFLSPVIPLGLDDTYVYFIGGTAGQVQRVAR